MNRIPDPGPHLPARPVRRMHHRLHRLGAAYPAAAADRPGAAVRLRARRPPRRSRRHARLQAGRQAGPRLGADHAVQSGRDAGASARAAAARGVPARVGTHQREQARCHPAFGATSACRSSVGAVLAGNRTAHDVRVRSARQQRRPGRQHDGRGAGAQSAFPGARFSTCYRNAPYGLSARISSTRAWSSARPAGVLPAGGAARDRGRVRARTG